MEHGVDFKEKKSKRPDMSTFAARFSSTQSERSQPNNQHSIATPADNSDLFRLLSDQLATIRMSATNPRHREFLEDLLEDVGENIAAPPAKIEGVSQEFLDTLDRVPNKSLKKTDLCPICGSAFLDDQYPLVVELPCSSKVAHRFDMDCIAPWLKMNGTCPMDRDDLRKRKIEIPKAEPEEEEWDDLYA